MSKSDISGQVRDRTARALAWGDAHVTIDDAVDGLAPELRGRRASGFPHSPWELLEHIRIAQHDLLDFCRNPSYEAPAWPEDYWPAEPGPPDDSAWRASIEAYRRDRDDLAALVRDTTNDLESPIPHGSGQTYLREVLVCIDHTAYHVGQLVAVRRLLGDWRG